MKRIILPVVSAALLSVAIIPMAQAAPQLGHTGGLHPTILNPTRTTPADATPSAQAQPISSIEQARLNSFDRVANASGSLNRSQAATANHLDPYNLASVSPLQQMRLEHLNRSN